MGLSWSYLVLIIWSFTFLICEVSSIRSSSAISSPPVPSSTLTSTVGSRISTASATQPTPSTQTPTPTSDRATFSSLGEKIKMIREKYERVWKEYQRGKGSTSDASAVTGPSHGARSAATPSSTDPRLRRQQELDSLRKARDHYTFLTRIWAENEARHVKATWGKAFGKNARRYSEGWLEAYIDGMGVESGGGSIEDVWKVKRELAIAIDQTERDPSTVR